VFDENEPLDVDAAPNLDKSLFVDQRELGSAVVVPLGDHGVFVTAARNQYAFDTAERYFAGLLSNAIDVALTRAAREQGLEGIQEHTRNAVAAATREAVAEEAIEWVTETLGYPLAVLWEYHSGENALRPLVATEMSRAVVGQTPTFKPGESIVWEAFQQGSIEIVEDTRTRSASYNTDSEIVSEIIVPMGNFGVLAIGSTTVHTFRQFERNLIKILAANVETAIQLVDQQTELEILDQVLARILRHNIRNDLTVIQGHAQQISNRSEGAIADAAETIISTSQKLETTAKRAREMRTIVANRDERIAVSLGDAIREAVLDVRDHSPAATITVDCEVDPTVIAHPHLTTALRHLIENGIEHDDGPGTDAPAVTVRTRATEEGATIYVADSGPGIPDIEIDVLNQHGENALKHGSGTGLWIVDRIVDYSNATLEFDVGNNGTTVSIHFNSLASDTHT
jgi:signal transduction histidine kinase